MPRPPYQPTAADRRRVEVMAGAGMSARLIADTLGLARGTLHKYFVNELTVGGARRRIELTEAQFAAAKRGKVSAMMAYLRQPVAQLEEER